MQHFLTGEELSSSEIQELLCLAIQLKKNRGQQSPLLKEKHLALLFDKPSLRTRLSFTVAMHELGGGIVESLGETRKKEEPEDMARVLDGYCHAVMVRTHSDEILTRMASVSKIPIINGLSDLHHPCQILADLMTIQEHFKTLEGLKVAYIGDGNNILHSLMLLAPLMGVHVHYCCPPSRLPHEAIIKKAQGSVTSFSSPEAAVKGASAVYTDVWASMGFEGKVDESHFEGFQVNERLMEKALPGAIFMHCLPMIRGKEVSLTLPDHPSSVIFQQSENRLHVQKALLVKLMTNNGV